MKASLILLCLISTLFASVAQAATCMVAIRYFERGIQTGQEVFIFKSTDTRPDYFYESRSDGTAYSWIRTCGLRRGRTWRHVGGRTSTVTVDLGNLDNNRELDWQEAKMENIRRNFLEVDRFDPFSNQKF